MSFKPLLLVTALLLGLVQHAQAETVVLRDDLASLFASQGTRGTFVLLDVAENKFTLINGKRAHKPGIPASTFKVANSLVALETGVIQDEEEIIPYGGKPQFLKVWEQDMSLRDAIRVSNLAVYRELARRIGLERYREWLARLDYGNANPGTDLENFWIRGPLKISAVEQVRFLARLAEEKLPLSAETQAKVKDIMILEKRGEKVLHGKTGWTTTPDPDLGWFVGWVQNGGRLHAFALNMDMGSRKDAPKRKDLSIKFLEALKIY